MARATGRARCAVRNIEMCEVVVGREGYYFGHAERR